MSFGSWKAQYLLAPFHPRTPFRFLFVSGKDLGWEADYDERAYTSTLSEFQTIFWSVFNIYILPLPLNTLESLEDPFDINL